LEPLTIATILFSCATLLLIASSNVIINNNGLSQAYPIIASTLLLGQASSFDLIAITTSNAKPDSSALIIQSLGFSMISSYTSLGTLKAKCRVVVVIYKDNI
jgi:hypothetical protein